MENKGCGKGYLEPHTYTCGERRLCPECSNKSPRENRSVALLSNDTEDTQTQEKKELENEGGVTQRSPNTFEPKTDRRCDLARNEKSKEAPEIIHKYGRDTEGYEALSSEAERGCQDTYVETNSPKSSPEAFCLEDYKEKYEAYDTHYEDFNYIEIDKIKKALKLFFKDCEKNLELNKINYGVLVRLIKKRFGESLTNG